MTSCCGLSSVTVITGCHSSRSSTATSSDCSSQMLAARSRRGPTSPGGSFARTISASAVDTIAIETHSLHVGQPPISAKWPRENVETGYLKRNLNTTPSSKQFAHAMQPQGRERNQ